MKGLLKNMNCASSRKTRKVLSTLALVGLLGLFTGYSVSETVIPSPQTESALQQEAESQLRTSENTFSLPVPVTSKRAAAGYPVDVPKIKTRNHVQHNNTLPSPSMTILKPHLNAKSLGQYQLLQLRLNEDLKKLAKDTLPTPKPTPRKPLKLSLREAILLALRNQPGVINDELDRVTQKFALVEQHWSDWEPKYSLNGSVALTRGSQTTYTLGEAGVSVKTPLGTQFSYTYNHDNLFTPGSQGGSTFTIDQPLLRGFGWAVNTADWYNALDQEEVNKLNFKGNMINAVVSVITDYRALVEAYNTLDFEKLQLDDTKQSLDQAKLKLKAGQISKSDYIQQQAQYKTQQVTYIGEQSDIFTSYAALLKDLGLDANAKIIINKKITLTNKYIPKLKKAIALALQGNINYQTALINLRQTERALITAKNAALWKLDAAYTTNIGGTAAGAAAGASGSSVVLNWDIPINRVDLQQNILNARIALEKARISLVETRLELVRSIKTAIITLHNDWQGILTAREQVDLENQTVNNIRLKIKYGQSTVFELNTEQQNLISYQNTLIANEITFMNGLTSLYQQLGLTLDIWHIKLRY